MGCKQSKSLKGCAQTKNCGIINAKSVVIKHGYELKYKELGGIIGHGAYGEVRHVRDIRTGEERACKVVNKRIMSSLDDLLHEIAILQSLDHPNIVKIIDVYEDVNYFYIIMELCKGGDLLERISEHLDAKGVFTEVEAKGIMTTLLKGVGYMHEHNIAHRDIKPDNILLTSHDDDAVLKIADFGFATECQDGTHGCSSIRGTARYIAPEILSGGEYGCSVDIFALGVLCYVLLSGHCPFEGDDSELGQGVFKKITQGEYNFSDEPWEGVSKEAKHFVKSLLITDPNKRYNYKQAMADPWIMNKQTPSSYDRTKQELLRKRFNNINAERKQRKAMLSGATTFYLSESDSCNSLSSLDSFPSVNTMRQLKLLPKNIFLEKIESYHKKRKSKSYDEKSLLRGAKKSSSFSTLA